jgi:hypothetical protein
MVFPGIRRAMFFPGLMAPKAIGDVTMRNFITTCVLVCFCCSLVRGEEAQQPQVWVLRDPAVHGPATVNVEDAANAAGEKAKADFLEAYSKQQEKASAAAARAARTWGKFAQDSGKAVYATGRYGVLMAGAGVANADGYVAYVVEAPSDYVKKTAFGLGDAAYSTANSPAAGK